MTNTPDILKKIITRKEEEVAECKKNISEKQMLHALQSPPFARRLDRPQSARYNQRLRFWPRKSDKGL
jgi:hypothetical protein